MTTPSPDRIDWILAGADKLYAIVREPNTAASVYAEADAKLDELCRAFWPELDLCIKGLRTEVADRDRRIAELEANPPAKYSGEAMTEAKTLTDDEIVAIKKAIDSGQQGIWIDRYGFWEISATTINGILSRLMLATIADRDRIIAQAKVMAEQQAKLIAELKENLVECENTLDHHIAVSQDRPVDQVVQARKIIRASRSSARPDDHHDSLHADAMATEAEKKSLPKISDIIEYLGKSAIAPMIIPAASLEVFKDFAGACETLILAAGFTRQQRQLDPGKVRQAVHKAILGDGMYATYLRLALSDYRMLQERADSDSVLDRVSEYLCSPGADIWK